MASILGDKITIHRGDTESFYISINSLGQSVDISDRFFTLSISARENPSISPLFKIHGIVINPSEDGLVRIDPTYQDVDRIGKYWYDVEMAIPELGSSISVTSIDLALGVVTVVATSHGFSGDLEVLLQGADQREYNGPQVITVIDDDSFSYQVVGTPSTPATGTITAIECRTKTLVKNRIEFTQDITK